MKKCLEYITLATSLFFSGCSFHIQRYDDTITKYIKDARNEMQDTNYQDAFQFVSPIFILEFNSNHKKDKSYHE